MIYPKLSSLGTSRTALQEIIFADVLNLSQERILQRIRPRWARAPIYFPGSEKSLLNRMEPFCSSFKSSPGFPLCLLSRLDSLLSSLRLLETIERSDEHSILVAITSIVRHCADVAYSKDHRSLEQQLRQIQIPNSEEILKSREVAQIDKLARYFGLSKDLANLARRSEYYHVTQNFSLEYITAYQASQPAGALRKCHVHAEVQLILHYEQHPLDKPPRVIGCSKSACFLCDLLIKMTGQYYISHAHRRLYNQWTIPDVPWMTMERVNYFRAILGGMIIKMGSLLENERRNNTNSQKQTFRPFGLESRAGLILSSNSDLSLSTLPSRLASSLPISCIPLNLLPQSIENKAKIVPVDSIKVGSTSRLSLVNLRRDDLPHQQPLNPNTGTLCLELDALTIIFECSSVSDGKLCIREIEEGARAKEDGARCIQVSDLTTDSITLRDRTNPSTLRFWLRISHSIAIEIEICWVVLK